MFYQTTYQLNGNIAEHNISSALYYSDDDTYEENYGDTFPFHCHSYYELFFMIEGYDVLESRYNIVDARPGCLVFYPPYEMHCIRKDCSRKYLILQFSPRLLKNALQGVMDSPYLLPTGSLAQGGSLFTPSDSELHLILNEIASLSQVEQRHRHSKTDTSITKSNSPQKELALNAAVYRLIHYLVEKGHAELTDSNQLTNNNTKIHDLMRQIIENPANHTSMEEAAAAIPMSYSNFSRAFKDAIGMNYVDFCNMIRVQKAQELLTTTTLSAAEISQQLDFGAFSYFTRMFKRYTGKTPSDYRMQKTK